MFKETNDGQTQYCPMCEEWAEKYEWLKAENEELKIKHQRYRECSIQFNQKLKQALEEVKRLLTIAMDKETVSYKHFELIEKSIKEINEVLKDENH